MADVDRSRTGKGKVVLVRGPIVLSMNSVNNEATPSIALAYLMGGLIKAGFDATMVDAIGEGIGRLWPLERYPGYQCQGLTFDEILDRIPPDTAVIGVSAMFSGEWPITRDLIGAIRARCPQALIVAGGEHVTALTEYCLNDSPAIDVCVRGEGERALVEVVRAHLDGNALDAIAGIAYREGSTIRFGSEAARIREIDDIAWPHWPEGYLERFWAAGKSYGVQSARDMPIMASRGCPYRCSFCSNPQMWTTRYILRDVDDVIAEIEHYIQRYAITSLQFYDLTAVTKKRWTMEFCQRLIDRGINVTWSLPSGTRSEALDAETLGMLKRTGCSYLVYAPESGSRDTLERINKRIDLPAFNKSVVEAKKCGLTLRTNLIIGFPHETRRHVWTTVLYGLSLAVRGVDEVSINIFSPYPGTALFQQLVAAGQVSLGDGYFLRLTSLNSDYSVINPMTVNNAMGPRELALYRICFMLTNYMLGYLLFPSRIVRTLRNILSDSHATTVFEHRLKDLVKRRAARKGAAPN